MNSTSGSRTSPRAGNLDGRTTYRIDVAGHLDSHWSDWLGDVALVRNDDATTTLTVRISDQAQLYGVVAGIRDLGVTLLSLRTVDETPTGRAESAPVLAHRLHTDRLTLRPATAADAEGTWTDRRLDPVNEW